MWFKVSRHICFRNELFTAAGLSAEPLGQTYWCTFLDIRDSSAVQFHGDVAFSGIITWLPYPYQLIWRQN